MKLVKTVLPEVVCNEITIDGPLCALFTLGPHFASIWPREDRVEGVGRVGSGRLWRTAGIKSSVRTDEIQASRRRSEEQPE